MDLENTKRILADKPGLSEALGMEFVSTPDDTTCMARMKVDERTRQPFGFLSGGATLALAETLAGAGSHSLCPGMMCVGVSVSGDHLKAAPEGETVTALARLLHKGRRLHVWNVDVTDESGELVSVVHVTNYVINPAAAGHKRED